MRRIVWGLSIVGGAAAFGAPSALAASPCPSDEWAFTHPAKSVFKGRTFPSVVAGSAQSNFHGVIAEPKVVPDGTKLPGVLLLHGRGGNLCGQWWAARLLASHGYIALTVTLHQGDDPDEASDIAYAAAKSAVPFMTGSDDPYLDDLDTDSIGMAGHSQGGMGVSRAQSELPEVKAVVGMDNLRKFAYNDPGSPMCQGPSLPVTPTVPGMGIGSESGCTDDLHLTDKLAGYRAWRHVARTTMPDLATMEVVLAHSTHGNFGGGGSHSDPKHLRQLRATGYYMRAWFDLWLKGNQSAYDRLRSPTPMGIPIDDMLSSKSPSWNQAAFHSAAFLPAQSVDCANLRSCL